MLNFASSLVSAKLKAQGFRGKPIPKTLNMENSQVLNTPIVRLKSISTQAEE
jgi:hypothetical protein